MQHHLFTPITSRIDCAKNQCMTHGLFNHSVGLCCLIEGSEILLEILNLQPADLRGPGRSRAISEMIWSLKFLFFCLPVTVVSLFI